MFGVIDLSRVYYTVAILDDATRRGARVAAVCPVDDPAIKRIAVFNLSGGTLSPLVNGLDASDILVEYLDADGAAVPLPATTGFEIIEFVRVSIIGGAGGFELETLVPGLSFIIGTPPMMTTMPRESLGIPRDGVAAQPC